MDSPDFMLLCFRIRPSSFDSCVSRCIKGEEGTVCEWSCFFASFGYCGGDAHQFDVVCCYVGSWYQFGGIGLLSLWFGVSEHDDA